MSKRHDPILAADMAEERATADALMAAKTLDDLMSVWFRDAERFEGAARDRLYDVYRKRSVWFVPAGLAG